MKKLSTSLLIAGSTFALHGGPITYTTPNLDTTAVGASKNVILGGETYVNKGLVGVGVYSSSLLDSRGDTLGAFSSFKIDNSTWRKNADGSYTGTLFTLPDRGYNVGGLIDYGARIQKFGLSFTPDYTTNTVGQTQLSLSFQGTTMITDFNGAITTAVNPTGTTLSGYSNVPTANGKFTLDSEGLAIRPDGSFYISEEYGATIYHVSKTGQMKGLITPVQALIPQFTQISGYSGFTTEAAAVTTANQTGGRRDNQGMEAVDVTPDGKFLVSMLQSATRQDTINNSDFNRSFTRLFIYDISTNATPTSPVEHYLVSLPTFSSKGLGATANKTAAQSEIVALSRSTFLVLTRDGNGNGSGNAALKSGSTTQPDNPMVWKDIALVSTVGATNLAGTIYETTYAPTVAGAGSTLAPVAGIVAATTTDFVNLLNVNQLARFGLNTNTLGIRDGTINTALAQNSNSLSEKWEALSVVPCLDAAYPNDYFLMVGNDNDFLTATGTMLGTAYNGVSTTPGAETVDNPNRILVYRVTLPGYVDPGLVFSATNRAPIMAAKSSFVARNMGGSFNSIFKSRLATSIRSSAPAALTAKADQLLGFEAPLDFCASGMPTSQVIQGGLRWWFDGSIRDINQTADTLSPALDSRANAGALGLEFALNERTTIGMGLGLQDGKSNGSDGSKLEYTGRSLTAYAINRGDVFFASLTLSYGLQDYGIIQSAGAYGSAPSGTTKGRSVSGELLLGATLGEVGGWSVVPLLGVARTSARLNGYSETGTGAVTFPTQSFASNLASASVELARSFSFEKGTITPFTRIGYDHEFGGKDQNTNVSVATNGGPVNFAMTLPNADRDYVLGTLGLRWNVAAFKAEVSYERRQGDNGYTEDRFNLNLSSTF